MASEFICDAVDRLSLPGATSTLGQRFVDKFSPGPEASCWLWQGATNNNGYGKITLGGKHGKIFYAHRLMHLALVGPIPIGEEIDHICHTRPCVNPAHLRSVPHIVNVAHGLNLQERRDRALRRTHCIHGHELTVENTVWRKRGTVQRDCRICRRDQKARTRSRG